MRQCRAFVGGVPSVPITTMILSQVSYALVSPWDGGGSTRGDARVAHPARARQEGRTVDAENRWAGPCRRSRLASMSLRWRRLVKSVAKWCASWGDSLPETARRFATSASTRVPVTAGLACCRYSACGALLARSWQSDRPKAGPFRPPSRLGKRAGRLRIRARSGRPEFHAAR